MATKEGVKVKLLTFNVTGSPFKFFDSLFADISTQKILVFKCVVTINSLLRSTVSRLRSGKNVANDDQKVHLFLFICIYIGITWNFADAENCCIENRLDTPQLLNHSYTGASFVYCEVSLL